VISNLALAVKQSEPKLAAVFPTKIKQKTALHTFLINCFYSDIYNCLNDDYPPSLVATFVSVALDDPTISIERVIKVNEHFQKKSE